ncbi:MAG: hypothetical protein HOP19_18475 [Acidobacteria bacterium]|nr:hypothetical protein [Acidobacteriota bacterium]
MMETQKSARKQYYDPVPINALFGAARVIPELRAVSSRVGLAEYIGRSSVTVRTVLDGTCTNLDLIEEVVAVLTLGKKTIRVVIVDAEQELKNNEQLETKTT